MVRPARAIEQAVTSTPTIDPLRRRLPGAADDERRRSDRHSGRYEITQALTLTNGQDRICMKIHTSPPSGRDSLTSRTPGGLVATSDRQQRVWELHLGLSPQLALHQDRVHLLAGTHVVAAADTHALEAGCLVDIRSAASFHGKTCSSSLRARPRRPPRPRRRPAAPDRRRGAGGSPRPSSRDPPRASSRDADPARWKAAR